MRAFSIRIRVVAWTGENDTETISVDAILFENVTKQYRFHLKTVLCGRGLIVSHLLFCNFTQPNIY